MNSAGVIMAAITEFLINGSGDCWHRHDCFQVYALQRAPFMVESAMATIAYPYLDVQRVPSLKETVGEQIRFLTESGMKLEPERDCLRNPC